MTFIKKHIILISSLFIFQNSISQKLSRDNQFKINIISPGITYERGLSSKSTAYIETSLFFRHYETTGLSSGFLLSPQLILQYRYYYNFEKRLEKEKNINRNSGDFFGVHVANSFKPIESKVYSDGWDGVTIGGIWGLQRSFKHHLILGGSAGVGYHYKDEQDRGIAPIVNLNLGWVIE